jgi:CRISPR-associated protein Cas2
MVFFDLPMQTDAERRAYTKFRKFLLRSGFIMMQKSVYSKLALNNTVAESIKLAVRKNIAKDGLVEMLVITEKQFCGIEYLIGEEQTTIIDSDKRLVEL